MSADKKDELKATEATEKLEGTAEGEEAVVEGGGKKRFGKKKILLIALPLIVIIGAGAAAYFLGYIGGHNGKVVCDNVKEGDPNYAVCAKELAKIDASKPGTFIDIPDMIVNLSSTSHQPRFLKISLKIELAKASDEAAMKDVMPRVVDQFQTYLRELRVEDLRGSSGLYRMKIELLNRVRAAAPGIDVKDVLFQEILIQ